MIPRWVKIIGLKIKTNKVTRRTGVRHVLVERDDKLVIIPATELVSWDELIYASFELLKT